MRRSFRTRVSAIGCSVSFLAFCLCCGIEAHEPLKDEAHALWVEVAGADGRHLSRPAAADSDGQHGPSGLTWGDQAGLWHVIIAMLRRGIDEVLRFLFKPRAQVHTAVATTFMPVAVGAIGREVGLSALGERRTRI